MPMTTSDAAINSLIVASEGFGPMVKGGYRVYKDCVGVVTGGLGHTAKAGPPIPVLGDVWSEEKCRSVLKSDLRLFESGLSKLLLGVKNVEQREFDALGSLAFNIGLGNLRSSSLLRAYRAGDKMTAARKFMDWNRAGGRVLPGLTTRRAKERAWFLDGRLGARTTTLLDEGSAVEAHYLDHPDNFVSRAINSLRAPSVEDWP